MWSGTREDSAQLCRAPGRTQLDFHVPVALMKSTCLCTKMASGFSDLNCFRRTHTQKPQHTRTVQRRLGGCPGGLLSSTLAPAEPSPWPGLRPAASAPHLRGARCHSLQPQASPHPKSLHLLALQSFLDSGGARRH